MGVGPGALAQVGMSRPDPGFWAGKRVLLTGHTGFKGAWTGLWLARISRQIEFKIKPNVSDAFRRVRKVSVVTPK